MCESVFGYLGHCLNGSKFHLPIVIKHATLVGPMAYIESGLWKAFSTMARSLVDGCGWSGGCNLLESFRFFILTKRAASYQSLMSIVSLTLLEETHICMPSATCMPTSRGLVSLHRTFGCENSPQTGAPLPDQKCTKSSVPSWDAAPIPPVLVDATWPPWRFMYATTAVLSIWKHCGLLVETLWAPDALLTRAGCICHHSFLPGNQAHLHAPLISTLHCPKCYWLQWWAACDHPTAVDGHRWVTTASTMTPDSTMAWTSLQLWRLPKTWHHPHRSNRWMWPNHVLQLRDGTWWGCEPVEDAGSGEWEAHGTLTGMSSSLWTFCSAPLSLCTWLWRTGWGPYECIPWAQHPETHALRVRTVCLIKSRLCMKVAQADDTTLVPIDLSHFRHHIKFNADENKFVKDKLRMSLQCQLKVVVFFFFSWKGVLSAEQSIWC